MISRIDAERAVYSALVVERAMVFCIFDDQMMGQPAKKMMHPVRDKQADGSSAWSGDHEPAKSAST